MQGDWKKMPQTICWGCQRATGGCSWADHGQQPVDGWKAIKTRLRAKTDEYTTSYIVLECPLFIADGGRHGRS